MTALPQDQRVISAEEQLDRRTAPRFALLYQAAKLISRHGEILCVVRDASTDGVRVRHFGHLPQSDWFDFELANGEVFPVRLIWRDEEHAGLKFPDEVDPDRLVRLATGDYSRRQLRLKTMLEGMVATDGREHCMTVRNISQQGACIECREDLSIDSIVQIETDALKPVNARIRWRLATIYGLVFEEPLGCEQLAEIVAEARLHQG